jgi:aldose sugar dehydrogenase
MTDFFPHFRLLRLPLAMCAFGFTATGLAAQQLSQKGEELYGLFCASCHGPELNEGSGGSLVDGVWKHGAGDAAFLAQVIQAGLPDHGMPGFGAVLDAPRVDALTAFILARVAEGTQVEPVRQEAAISAPTAFRLETVVEGLEIPWSLAFLPGDEGMLIAERGGQLRLARAGRLDPRPILGIPEVRAHSQGGLLVVQAHPDSAKNGWIYLAYSEPVEGGAAMTTIVRGRIRDHRWTEQETIYRAAPEHFQKPGHHYGVRLVFDAGYLYFGIGDRGSQNQAQDLALPQGKIHRLHDDGRVPVDNPFVNTPGALPSIWSYGHRNPQGLIARPGTTGAGLELWETEHGPRGGDELNRVYPGENYGWPVVTYGINYNGTPISERTEAPGMRGPVLQWTPSLAVCGLDFYSGEGFPAWRGDLLVGALVAQELRRVRVEGERFVEQEVLLKDQGRVRSVHTGPDGFIYLALEGPGRIARLVPEL